MEVIILNVLEVIGGFIGILAIIIVIWDHFKDDRRLTREVQEYYESIELLIGLRINLTRERNKPNNNETRIKLLNEFEFHQTIVKTKFDEFSKYLGLIIGKSNDSRYERMKVYTTISGFKLVEDGNLICRDPIRFKKDRLLEFHAVGNENFLSKQEATYLNSFYSDLRNHWKEKYAKALFRPTLKQKFNFNGLITEK